MKIHLPLMSIAKHSRYLFSFAILMLITSAAYAIPPAITSQPVNRTVCQGASGIKFSVTATNATSYKWQVDNGGGGGFTDITNGGVYSFATSNVLTLNNIPVSMNNYSFRCIATGPDNPAATSNIATLTVNGSLSVLAESAGSTVICSGANATFSLTVNGTVTGYQWYGYTGSGYVPVANTSYYSGATTPTLTLTNVTNTPKPYAAYYCVASGPCGTVKSAAKYLTVNDRPSISAGPVSVTACNQTAASFSVTAAGTGLSFQWQVSTNGGGVYNNLSNTSLYSGVNTSQLNISAVTTGMDNYRYRCVVSGTCPSPVTSGHGVLTVTTKPAITSQPVNSTICSGSNTYYTVKATGSNLAYQWQYLNGTTWSNLANGTNIDGATTDSLQLIGITANSPLNNEWFRCIVSGSCPATLSSDFGTLTVNTAPSITAHPTSVVTCDGSNTSFSVSATGSNLAYQWQVNAGSGWSNVNNNLTYSGAATNKLMITNVSGALNSSEYRCVVSGSCPSPVTSNPASLTVPQTVTPSVSVAVNYNNICYGIPVTFTATPTNGGATPTYVWRVNNVIQYTGPSRVYISATLNNNDIVHCEMISNALCPTVAKVTSNAVIMIVTQYEEPTIDITTTTGSNTACSGVPVTFTTSTTYAGPNPGFQWQINGTNTGSNTPQFTTSTLNDNDVVRCIITSSYLCPASTFATSNNVVMDINQTTPATVSISNTRDTTICRGTEVKLFAYYTNSGTDPKFQWMNNGKDIPGATGPTYTSAFFHDNDIIKCRFTSSATCVFPVTSEGLNFNVEAPVMPKVTLSVHYAGDNKYTFVAMPEHGGDNPTYEWYVNNMRVPGATSALYTAPVKVTDRVHVVMTSNYFCVAATEVSSKFITTGIDNSNIAFNQLVLYPNPNTGKFTVSGEYASTGNEKATITVVNAVGQVLYTGEASVNMGKLNHEINMNTPAAGMYMVRIDVNGKQEVRRFSVTQ